MRALIATLVVLLASLPLSAQSSIEEVRSLIVSYHEDLTRLDRSRDLMEKFVKTDSRVEGMILLSRISFMWGDVRAKDDEEKLAAYDRGRQLGKRAIELAPKNPEAHFWYAANTGRWGTTKGVFRSLVLLPTLREEVDTLLTLAPDDPATLGLAGNVELAIPWGDLDKAEEYFRKGLKIDPRHTAVRVDFARLLIKRGQYGEARKELQRVLNEKTPRFLADWSVKHTKRARELLDSIKDKS
ncbi:MAG: tetratricopeptide repeat protein [Candidatus Rokuibacteriota bacterium]